MSKCHKKNDISCRSSDSDTGYSGVKSTLRNLMTHLRESGLLSHNGASQLNQKALLAFAKQLDKLLAKAG